MKINKFSLMRHFALLLLAMFFLVSEENACAQSGHIRELFMGSEHCTWDKEGKYVMFYQPYKVTAESCRQWAEESGDHYIGEGNKEDEAKAIPAESCSCGQTWRNVYFDPQFLEGHPEPTACRGISYACSKPATDCRWIKVGLLTEDVTYTEECRLKARECGNPYYGYNSETEASKAPETDCICGESTIKWYSDYQPHLSADFKCIGIKYSCLKKNIMKVVPDKRFQRLGVYP
jgi:hypothetical protein